MVEISTTLCFIASIATIHFIISFTGSWEVALAAETARPPNWTICEKNWQEKKTILNDLKKIKAA